MKQGALGALAALLAAGPLFAQPEPPAFFHLRPVAAPGQPAPAVQQLPDPPARPPELPTLPAPTPLPADTPLVPEAVSATIEDAGTADPWATGRRWLSAELLIWWTSRPTLATPLLSTGTGGAQPLGTVGAPGTTILFNDSNLRYDRYVGTRVKTGYWLNPEATSGVEGGAFIAPAHGVRFVDLSSTGVALPPPVPLARPFFDVQAGAPSALTIVSPGTSSGSISISSDSLLWGGEANLVRNLSTSATVRADLVAGFRYFDLKENLGIVQDVAGDVNGNITFTGLPVAAGTTVEVADRFQTRNQFTGGQVGTRLQVLCCDCLVVSAVGMLALGPTHESLNVLGSTKLLGANATVPGGFLALPGNIGRQTRDEFTFIPQVGFDLGMRCGDHCRFTVGYDFLYWSRVVRPGDQINPFINLTQVPSSSTFGPLAGPAGPVPVFRQTDFWAQGLHLGVEVSY